MKKRFLAVILALVMCVGLAPAAFAAEEDFRTITEEYWSGSTKFLVEYVGPGGDVVVPDDICATRDTSGKSPFQGCANITSIKFNFQQLGEGLFEGCTGLTSVTFGKSVTYSPSRSYMAAVFDGCPNLTDILVDPENKMYTSIDGVLCLIAYEGNGRPREKGDWSLSVYPTGKTASSYTIPDSISLIGDGAFHNCKNLTSVVLNNHVTSIGREAFKDCTSLTSITLPDSVTDIGLSAFEGCASLTSVTIPGSITGIGLEFSGCTGLTIIAIPDSIEAIIRTAFNGTNITDIYYAGSPEQWKEIELYNIEGYPLGTEWELSEIGCENATIHYNSARAKFFDVKFNGFYVDAVEWALSENVTTGKTESTFAPNENCTHGQILTFLWRAAGKPESSAQPPIAMKGDEFYYKAVKWAAEKGMIGRDFAPEAGCTRADAVNYIWQAFGKPAAAYDGRFTDVPAGSPYATAVAWALANEVTTGATATTFSPAKICNRGEIVTFLYRAYK